MTTTELTLDPRKEAILEKLRTDETNVKFTKVDGTERTMRCTLVESQIPVDKRPKTSESETTSTAGSAIRVFDLDKQEWRSFRVSSVISF
jgi:hypothetical protein